MSLSRLFCVALVFVLALPLAACDSVTGCTLIGCVNTLTVEVANAPAGAITVAARVPGSSDSARTASCPGVTNCTNSVDFVNFTPDNVELTITTSAGTRTVSVQPTYIKSYPNGRSCGPECSRGTARVTW